MKDIIRNIDRYVIVNAIDICWLIEELWPCYNSLIQIKNCVCPGANTVNVRGPRWGRAKYRYYKCPLNRRVNLDDSRKER